MQRKIENSGLICGASEDSRAKRTNQENCRKLEELTNKKTEGKGTCKYDNEAPKTGVFKND